MTDLALSNYVLDKGLNALKTADRSSARGLCQRAGLSPLQYDAQSAVERELVLRLASLLWRLRRATAMETGMFEIQAEQLKEFRRPGQALPASGDYDRDPASDSLTCRSV